MANYVLREARLAGHALAPDTLFTVDLVDRLTVDRCILKKCQKKIGNSIEMFTNLRKFMNLEKSS